MNSILKTVLASLAQTITRTLEPKEPPKFYNRLLYASVQVVFHTEETTALRYVLWGFCQGHVIVKPNLLIFKVLAGYGYLFFGLCPHIV